MTRVFANEDLSMGMIYHLNESDSHHIMNVLRLTIGDEITVIDSNENEYLATINRIENKSIVLVINELQQVNREPSINVTIFQGLPKSDKMETVIMKATEIGASEFVPVAMKRSVVILKDKKAQKKQERWQKIASSAASQAKRQRIPVVKHVHSFSQMLGCLKGFTRVFALYENEEQKSVYDIDLTALSGNIAIVVGPEGGFEDSEITFLTKSGAECITLGPRILRTETAALNFLSVLLFCSGDMRRS